MSHVCCSYWVNWSCFFPWAFGKSFKLVRENSFDLIECCTKTKGKISGNSMLKEFQSSSLFAVRVATKAEKSITFSPVFTFNWYFIVLSFPVMTQVSRQINCRACDNDWVMWPFKEKTKPDGCFYEEGITQGPEGSGVKSVTGRRPEDMEDALEEPAKKMTCLSPLTKPQGAHRKAEASYEIHIIAWEYGWVRTRIMGWCVCSSKPPSRWTALVQLGQRGGPT